MRVCNFVKAFTGAIVGLALAATGSRAATMTVATAASTGLSGENAFALQFAFDPIVVPGTVLGVEADFSGCIYPGMGAFVSNGAVDTVTITPHATFGNSFSNTLFPVASDETSGARVTLPFAAGTALSNSRQNIALSGSFGSGPSIADALASGPFVIEVDLFSTLLRYRGHGAVDGADMWDNSNGFGTLALTVSYDPAPTSDLPEPSTLALMSIALAGSGLFRRRNRLWAAV